MWYSFGLWLRSRRAGREHGANDDAGRKNAKIRPTVVVVMVLSVF